MTGGAQESLDFSAVSARGAPPGGSGRDRFLDRSVNTALSEDIVAWRGLIRVWSGFFCSEAPPEEAVGGMGSSRPLAYLIGG